MTNPKLAVVIPTLGDRQTLSATLNSIDGQSLRPSEVVIVNQGPPALVERIVRDYPDLNVIVIPSTKGVARARNAGIQALSAGWEYLATPDDDVILDARCFEMLVDRMSDAAGRIGATSALLVDNETGLSRIRFGGSRVRLTRRTVWTTAIETTMLYERSAIDAVGGFDESLGLGAGTRWGSGEGTDLLLRILDTGREVWYEPAAKMAEIHRPPASQDLVIERVRSYARGTGRVFALRERGWQQVLLIIRSLGRVLLSLSNGPNRRTSWAVLQGRLEGLTGATRRGRSD